MSRYSHFCDKLALLMIESDKIYSVSEAKSKFNTLDNTLAEVTIVPNLHRPYKNFFNLFLRMKALRIIESEIKKADRVIIRAPGRFLTNNALRLCRKHHKLYLVESVDFPLEFMYHKRITMLFAPYGEFSARREIARAPYVAYVSQRVLQERYPTSGKSLACSDVELPELDPEVLRTRINTYGGRGTQNSNRKIVFGTAAGVSKLKGQEYVVRAIAELRKQGITNIEYHLAGPDTRNYLHNLINSLNLQDCVKLYGAIPHDKIFDWYDHLDVYIQPSFTEAICRSVIEAMSRALPVTCSSAGGNPEIAGRDMLFTPGNVTQICEVMKKMLDPEIRKRESERSFTKAKEFEKSRLDPIRDKFYMDFINGN